MTLEKRSLYPDLGRHALLPKASVSCKRISGHPPACYFGGRLFWPLLSLFGSAHAQFNYQN